MAETVRIRAVVAYDGSAFHGFAEQPDVRTVAGDLRVVLERTFGSIEEFVCAGRTDTGVHGSGQVIHADVSKGRFDRVELSRVQRSMNKQLAPQIVLRSLERADETFHARFSATARKYRYLVLNAPLLDPLMANIVWWMPDELNVDAMNNAAQVVVGEHDFTTFCRHPKGEEVVSLTRCIHSALWTRDDNDVVRFDIEANAFCHQMVRALTGMFVEIGRGRRPIGAMAEAMAAKDRSKGASLAPPHGLCLREVVYGD